MKDRFKNLQLGIFVLTGTVLFILALYLVGTKKNIFGSNLKIKARFNNVNGLMEGNNVRFGGIDIGSIEKIIIISDSNVQVEMWIDKKAGQYIRKNYTATIGTDGLMGNRLINIHPEKGKSNLIVNGDELNTINPLETEEMLRAFNATGINMKSITENLNAITIKLKQNNALWEILGEKKIAVDIERFIKTLNITGSHAQKISEQVEEYAQKINNKKSFISKLSSEELSDKFSVIIDNISTIEDSTLLLITELNQVTKKINQGKGTISKLLNDSVTSGQINQTMEQIKNSAKALEEDLEGLKSSIFLRRYFKKKSKSVK